MSANEVKTKPELKEPLPQELSRQTRIDVLTHA